MDLYLIRHGQSYANLRDWQPNSRANIDAGLTELGQRQAMALTEWLRKNVPVADALYASTMLRTRETAVYVSHAYNCDIIYDDRLREIGNNRIDHTPVSGDELPTQYLSHADSTPFTPVALDVANAESFAHFRARAGMFLDDMAARHQDETVLVVCHGGVINAAFDNIFNIGPYRHCDIRDPYTSITLFQRLAQPEREPWQLRFQGRVEHLQGLE
ncbi:MAG: histidine phosphatase family protein [Chloroflexi bacterium]|nr:histidine phosphatase family protein [Chloroflexota bacterium]